MLNMWFVHANLIFFLAVVVICLLRLIGEAIGYGNVLFKGMPFLWLSLSLGFLLTWQVVLKGLEVYSVIFTWVRESLLMNIVSGSFEASINWNSLLALSVLAWPIRDMTVRWNMVHYRWAVSFPPYAQMFLHIAAVLYIVFIVIQGLYLVTAIANTELVCRYCNREHVQKCARNLILVNVVLLLYDIMWFLTTVAIEGDEQYLYKVLNLGCVGLVVYDLCAVAAWMKLQTAIADEPDNNIDCDDPTESITLLQHLVPVFLVLSISREFNTLIFPSSLSMLLPILFLALGSIMFGFKSYLLHSSLFRSLLPNIKKQPSYTITAGGTFMAILSIYSCLVNACQGFDSYHRWLSNSHPIFSAFLALYCTIYTLHIAHEGFLVVWQLSYPECMAEESTKRSLDNTILSACGESSVMFALYQIQFVLYLPDAGTNLATLGRFCGPVLFHFSTVIAYLHLKEKCYWRPKQAHIENEDADENRHKVVCPTKDLIMKSPTEPSHNHPTTPAPSYNPGLPVFLWNVDYFQRLWQSASSTMAKYALPVLLLLGELRFLLFGKILAPFLSSWFMTRCFWHAYILVCAHWVMVMHRELHGITVVKKCYSSMYKIVARGDACKYSVNMCWGMVFLLVVVLTMLNIYFRASHSAHEWAGPQTLALQIMVVPLLGIHVYSIVLQGLILYGAITATDTITEATENSEVPTFTENLPKLKYINIVLLIDHLIFMVLSSGGVFVIYEWPLLIFHLGSSVVIYILQQRGRELDKPRDAPNEPERIIADPIECCLLARWIPLQRTGALMKITAVVGIVRLALNVHSFQGDWLLVVAFRALTSLTLAVVNYYIYKSLTKQLINYTHWRIPEKKLPFILYIIVGCCGIAEVLYAFHCQWTAKKDGYFWLDLSLTFTALMNVALIVHEDILVIYLVSLDSQVEERAYLCNLKQALQLVLHLNMFYAGFGAFSSFLAWLVSDGGSLIHLLGHLTCAILVPTMASPVLERMYNDINKDLQCNVMGTNEEGEGFNEQVHDNAPALSEEFKHGLLRNDEE